MLGTRTWDGRIEGADESTELRRHRLIFVYFCNAITNITSFLIEDIKKVKKFNLEFEGTPDDRHTDGST